MLSSEQFASDLGCDVSSFKSAVDLPGDQKILDAHRF